MSLAGGTGDALSRFMMKAHEAIADEEPLASRSHALPWMEEGVRRSYERKNHKAVGVLAAIVVIAFLLALFLALPLLLLQML
ncbi:MAG TPA: hypothetical protein VMZ28_07820 [Kofleriaceae bacterium]|nr:hypothetical protein [Kofleriaceae bacterium]